MTGFTGLLVVTFVLGLTVIADGQQAAKLQKIGYLSNSGGQSVPDSAFLNALRSLRASRKRSVRLTKLRGL